MIALLLRASAGAAALGAASLLLASPALAQQAGIEITVVDTDGAPVADAEVVIANPAIGLVCTVRTDARGTARVDGLITAGEYQVSYQSSMRLTHRTLVKPVPNENRLSHHSVVQEAALWNEWHRRCPSTLESKNGPTYFGCNKLVLGDRRFSFCLIAVKFGEDRNNVLRPPKPARLCDAFHIGLKTKIK